MTELFFPTIQDRRVIRPVFSIQIEKDTYKCLIDTGADIPVWCKGMELFSVCFPSAIWYKDTTLGGFGIGRETIPIYIIDNFILSDTYGNKIQFHNFKIAITDRPGIPCDIILCITMFSKMKCTFDYSGNPPYVKISSEKDCFGIGIYQDNDSVYAFLDE